MSAKPIALLAEEARDYGGNATDEGQMALAQVLATCALVDAVLLVADHLAALRIERKS